MYLYKAKVRVSKFGIHPSIGIPAASVNDTIPGQLPMVSAANTPTNSKQPIHYHTIQYKPNSRQ
jgi:hypothetical protein